jgi:ribosomal protein L24
MNQARVSPVVRDQLINQIIHQGKAKGSVFATDTYSRSMSVKGCKLRPVPGSRDNNSTNPKGRAFRNGAPVKGSQLELLILGRINQRILSPLATVDQSLNDFHPPQPYSAL